MAPARPAAAAAAQARNPEQPATPLYIAAVETSPKQEPVDTSLDQSSPAPELCPQQPVEVTEANPKGVDDPLPELTTGAETEDGKAVCDDARHEQDGALSARSTEAVEVEGSSDGELAHVAQLPESRPAEEMGVEVPPVDPPAEAAAEQLMETPTPAMEDQPTESPGPVEQPARSRQSRGEAAKRLFLYVTGVLNGAHAEELVRDRVDDMVEWLGEDGVSDAPANGAACFWVADQGRTACASFPTACDALAAALKAGVVPPSGIRVLTLLSEALRASIPPSASLLQALEPHLCPSCSLRPPASATCSRCRGSGTAGCPKCSGSGRYTAECRNCAGTGLGRRPHTACTGCSGRGRRDLGACNRCQGKQLADPCDECETKPPSGCSRPFCDECIQERRRARANSRHARVARREDAGPPPEGVTIERCSASQLADLKTLWEEREGSGEVLEAWRVDNPLLAWNFHARRAELKRELGRDPDDLQGYHGTHPTCVLPISQNGFDQSKRSGQVFGAGEYFAKCPDVSMGYCKGGDFMLVCRLCLGVESSSQANIDGDHIWVPSSSYYVISSAAQVLPLYIIRYAVRYRRTIPKCPQLDDVLQKRSWSTKRAEAIIPVPPNRPCLMSRPSATVLWIGLLHAHFSDEQLDTDVRSFLSRHAPRHLDGLKVQIVKGTFKKAHAILTVPIPRDLVHRLNQLPFKEGGKDRTVCVEDAHGSPEQKCPKWIAGYCRGQNLRFTHPCWCWHPRRETENTRYHLEEVALTSAKGNEIADKFMKSAPFHNGMPRVVRVRAIINQTLARCHEGYRRYLATKHGEEPTVRELYHGTNNNIMDTLCTHGLQPPSDTNASERCPVSGGKGLSTTLCTNSCQYCTERHEWDRCHMFGLGIYLADLAQKSHRYCSQPETVGRKRIFRMLVCSVLGRAFKIEGHLRHSDAMHDVANVRALQEDELAEMIEPCCSSRCRAADEIAEKSDLLFVQGLGSRVRPGSSVVNSEYIAYHPHQCLPKYEITYEMSC